MNFIAIDPGKHCVGWARFTVGKLVRCGLARSNVEPFEKGLPGLLGEIGCAALSTEPLQVVIEVPRVYPKDRGRNPNDLIDLATVAGACTRLGIPTFIHPAQWKGQVPKAIQHERVRSSLSQEERGVLDAQLAAVPKSLQHNVLDAVGIGCWWRNHG